MTDPTETNEIAYYLEGLLREGLDPLDYAKRLTLAGHNGSGVYEVPSRDTASGNPLPFTL